MTDINFAVVDIETTGLDANADVPLELGIVLVDKMGYEVDSCKWLVWEEEDLHFQKAVQRGRENSFVNQMHTDNGLWDDLETFACYSRDGADSAAVRWLENKGVPTGKDAVGMTGNSTGSLDRPFSLVHFPKLNTYLGYRNIDISSVKELCKRLNPELWAAIEPLMGSKEDAAHRVIEDARACIKELGIYVDEFLIVP